MLDFIANPVQQLFSRVKQEVLWRKEALFKGFYDADYVKCLEDITRPSARYWGFDVPLHSNLFYGCRKLLYGLRGAFSPHI